MNGGVDGIWFRMAEMEGVLEDEKNNLHVDTDRIVWCIINDDMDTLARLIQGVSESQIKNLVNSELNYKDSATIRPTKDLCVSKPLALAMVYGSFECFKFLLDKGADLHLTDVRRNNLIHLLVVAHQEQSLQMKFYNLILNQLKGRSSRVGLLQQENQDGYHPLELATFHRNPRLVKAILHTESVYRTTIARRGKMILNKYDFSMYADSTRRFMNFPLNLLALTEINDLGTSREILQIPIMQKTLTKRLEATIVYTYLWFLLRFVYVGFFIYGDHLYSQVLYQGYCNYTRYFGTNLTFNEALDKRLFEVDGQWVESYNLADVISSIVIGLMILVFDVWECWWYWRKKREWGLTNMCPSLFRPYVVNSNFYRVAMAIYAVTIVTYGFSLQVADASDYDRENLTVVSVLSPLLQRMMIPFTLMPFFQILPLVGEFIIGFHKMLSALVRFSILQITIMYIFSNFLVDVVAMMCQPTSYTCGKESVFYETFLILLNMDSVNDTVCTDQGTIVLRIIYVIYIFVVAITTINYMIAVMSAVYGIMGNDMTHVVELHRIDMAMTIERRVRAAIDKFPCLKFFRIRGSYEIEILETDDDHDQGFQEYQPEANGQSGPPKPDQDREKEQTNSVDLLTVKL